MNSIIEATDLYKNFKKKEVLKGVSFIVSKGEIFGLLGPSGAGKTTILNLITGQLSPSSGTIKIFGKITDKINSQTYIRMGMMMESTGLYSRLTCFQNLKIMAMIYKLSEGEISKVLKKVDLLKEKDTVVEKMSKGMRQRLAFAKSILNTPEILFLDEPTTGLDPVTTSYIHNLILELADTGTTIILTTHNMNEATELCDNVGLLNDGNIIEYGNPQDLCFKYREKDSYKLYNKEGEELLIENNEQGREQISLLFKNDNIKSIHTIETDLQTIFVTLTGKRLDDEQ